MVLSSWDSISFSPDASSGVDSSQQKTGSMTHSQESRVSITQDNFRLSEESRSGVSALVSRLSSSTLGVDHSTDNEKLRGDSPEMRDPRSQDPFPWMAGFCKLCQAAVGSRSVRHLESLMKVYLENITPNVTDCYKKPNRAAKLKKSMNNILIFFHLFYQEIKETLEHSFYLEKMTLLVSMFMDMEIKASLRGKESLKKVASRLTSSLYIFLDNSEEHMLDAILMTKFVHKNYRDIWHPLFEKLLDNIRPNRMNDLMYVRCLLTFKLWKKIFPYGEGRTRINTTAMQKLQAPPHLMENMKAMGNVLPRIPKTKKNITLFLMQSNFNVKSSCQEFLMSMKKPRKSACNQGLGAEINKPLFFVNHSGDSSPRLTEKEDESDSCGNNLVDDIWPSISTIESNAPSNKRLNDLTPEQPSVVGSQETPKKKKKKAEKKKGKKQKVVKCVGNKKKKKSIGSGDKTGKLAKRCSKLKGKKKKKKKILANGDSAQAKPKQVISPQVEDRNQLKVTTSLTQIEECSQVIALPNSPVFGEHSQIRVVKADQLIADSFLDEGSQKAQLKQPSSNREESVTNKDSETLPQIGDSAQVLIQTLGKRCDKSLDQKPKVEENNNTSIKKSLCQAEESVEITSNKVSSTVEECDLRKNVPNQSEADDAVLKVNCASPISEELKTKKNTQFINKLDDVNQNKAKTASLNHDDFSGKVSEPFPHVDEKSKNEQTFLYLGDNDQFKHMLSMHQIGEYDKIEDQKVVEQLEDSKGIDSKQAMFKFTDYDDKIREAKIEPQLGIPKTEKCDSPSSVQNDESELLCGSIEPPVKKLKVEIVTNACLESFEDKDSVAPDAINADTDITDLSVEKTVGFVKCHDLSKEAINNELNAKCASSEEAESAFDNSGLELFRVDSSKEQLSVKALECSAKSIATLNDECKPSDLSQKSKTVENSASVSVYSAVELCDSSLKQELCDTSETSESGALEVSKTVHIDSNSDVEIVDEFKTREAGKSATSSEEEFIYGGNGVSLAQPAAPDSILMEIHSESVYPMSEGISTGYSWDLNSDAELNDLGPSNSLFTLHLKGDEPYLQDPLPDWLNDKGSLELDRPILPSTPMEDYEASENDTPKSFVSSTPKRGMGKISYDDSVYSFRKEACAYTTGRYESQVSHMMNSSESGSSEASPHASSASGSSSPRSESAIDTVECVPECLDTSVNVMKTAKLDVSCEPVYTSVSFYTPKSPEVASSTKDVGHNAQASYTSKIGSHHMDDARVVVETMPHNTLNQAISDKLSATSSKPETSSRRNISETSSQHSPLKRKKSAKLPPEQTVDSHSSPGKNETREAGNYAAESRAPLRGQGRRGRPPSRRRGVSSTCKLASDSKSTRKQGYSGKGRNDPEFQISSSKKYQPYDPPLTRSISKKIGISGTDFNPL
ncbi:uncharacterized protein [Hetaerina americana]|uniref:uncharacterized protein isoform X2 n=1 Tax=Hetaerina americana TaxID=62018 RepID=UPI003A7F4AA8